MNKKALIVDDNKMIREVFSHQLIACGVDAQSCASLDDTLDIIQDWQPDIVFLDLQMPGHTGYEVIEQIQSNFSAPPKVVAVTGSDNVRQQTNTAGFDGLMIKPFSMTQLVAILKNLLP